MRYLTNTIKSIINILLDIGFFFLALYYWYLNYSAHSKWDFILYLIAALFVTYTIDCICVVILSRKYNESGSMDLLGKIANNTNIKEEEKKEE